MVIDLIRGRDVPEALTLLKYLPRAAAPVVEKLLQSAVANAGQKDMGDAESLRIVRAYVDGAPTLRRFRARSMGRANPIHKRTSHVTIVVGPSEGA
jgi:large subunit ribosomal protein L22